MMACCRYGKVGIFVFAAWGGNQGGIIAGLATGTALGVITGSAADLMQVQAHCTKNNVELLQVLAIVQLKHMQ